MTEETTRPAKKLGGGPMEFADYQISRFVARAPAGTTLEEVLHPQYFQNVLSQFKMGTEVVVLSEDMELDVRLRVLTFDKFRASVRVLNIYAAPDADKFAEGDEPKEAVQIEGVQVTFGGPRHLWRVMVDGEVIQHGFATREDAEGAAADL